jgi:hypothetical protein
VPARRCLDLDLDLDLPGLDDLLDCVCLSQTYTKGEAT